MSYIGNAKSALALIKRKGAKGVTISRPGTDAVFNPVAGTETAAGTPLTGPIACVILPYNQAGVQQLSASVSGDNADQREGVRGRMRKLLVAALGAPFEPDSGDTVANLESSSWEVLGCNPLCPDGVTNIIYDLTIRKK
jgi:hypothetical protein